MTPKSYILRKGVIMKNRVHIFGASGSGTTTIAKAVSEKLNYKHFEFYYKYKPI